MMLEIASSKPKTFWSPINSYSDSAIDGCVRKRRPKSFFTLTVAIFLKSCFYRPLRFRGRDLKNLHNKYQNTFFNLLNCSLGFVRLAKQQDVALSFFNWNNKLFFSKTCVFNNLLGVEELILELASQMLKKLVEPKKCFSKSAMVSTLRKNGQTFIFTGMIAISLKSRF